MRRHHYGARNWTKMNVQMVAWVHDGRGTGPNSDWRFKVKRKRG
jgi:hypothetical protein